MHKQNKSMDIISYYRIFIVQVHVCTCLYMYMYKVLGYFLGESL